MKGNKNNIGYIIIIMLSVAIFTGCSSSYEDARGIAQSIGNVSESNSKSTSDETIAVERETDNGIEVSLDSELNRKIIKTGNVYIETKTFEETTNTIINRVSELGGFIQHSYIRGSSLYESNASQRAELVIRIPQQSFDSFINNADEFGNVVSRSMTGEDITDQYVDLEGRKRSLEIRKERLLELLEQSGSLKELFEIEQELSQVTYELERLTGRLQEYDSLIEYSTIEIEVQEVVEYTKSVATATFGEQIGDNFRKAISSFKVGVQNIILWGVRNFIMIIILFMLGGVVGHIIRVKKMKGIKIGGESTKEDKNDKKD